MFGFDTLDFSKKIFICASGGRDSTAMALALKDYSPSSLGNISLLWENTRVTKLSARKTLERLADYTGFPLIEVRYEGKEKPIQILKESFKQIPKALEHVELGKKSYKKFFRCCDVLKKQPSKDFISQFEKDEIILFLGFKAGDKALHRVYRMSELRGWDTFYRRKKDGYLYFYPLRDCQEKDIETILKHHEFESTKSSGCTMCPVFCVADWDKKDPETARRSKALAKRLGIDLRAENQRSILEFCSGGVEGEEAV